MNNHSYLGWNQGPVSNIWFPPVDNSNWGLGQQSTDFTASNFHFFFVQFVIAQEAQCYQFLTLKQSANKSFVKGSRPYSFMFIRL